MRTLNWLRGCMDIREHKRCIKKSCYEKRKIWWSDNLIEIVYVPSRINMSNVEREKQWYTNIQVELFAYEEIERRKNIGIKSRKALCPEMD